MVFNLGFTEIKFFLKLTIVFLLLNACSSSKFSGDYQYETECLGVELDGSQTLKAWGNGRNRMDAVEQAKKNAVFAVIFQGINNGKELCENKPLITQPNAREINEDYFNVFFNDKGAYLAFVNLKDERLNTKIYRSRKSARQSITHGVVVRVLRSELKKKLINDGIIKLN